jgi:hypothetical protein
MLPPCLSETDREIEIDKKIKERDRVAATATDEHSDYPIESPSYERSFSDISTGSNSSAIRIGAGYAIDAEIFKSQFLNDKVRWSICRDLLITFALIGKGSMDARCRYAICTPLKNFWKDSC